MKQNERALAKVRQTISVRIDQAKREAEAAKTKAREAADDKLQHAQKEALENYSYEKYLSKTKGLVETI